MPLIAQALTTVEMARAHLNISASDTSQTARLELFINAATQRLESITSRALAERTHSEFRSGRRGNVMLLREWPVSSISALYIDNESLFGPESLIAPSEYVIGDGGNTLILRSTFFQHGLHNVKIDYTAGYNTTVHAAQRAELELACLWLVEWFYRHRERGDMGRTAKSKGDESVGILAAMPEMIREIVASYQRVEMPLCP
jgi:uncharacterized phiE125 gp8 family phage protein